jgi:hypothetical protein
MIVGALIEAATCGRFLEARGPEFASWLGAPTGMDALLPLWLTAQRVGINADAVLEQTSLDATAAAAAAGSAQASSAAARVKVPKIGDLPYPFAPRDYVATLRSMRMHLQAGRPRDAAGHMLDVAVFGPDVARALLQENGSTGDGTLVPGQRALGSGNGESVPHPDGWWRDPPPPPGRRRAAKAGAEDAAAADAEPKPDAEPPATSVHPGVSFTWQELQDLQSLASLGVDISSIAPAIGLVASTIAGSSNGNGNGNGNGNDNDNGNGNGSNVAAQAAGVGARPQHGDDAMDVDAVAVDDATDGNAGAADADAAVGAVLDRNYELILEVQLTRTALQELRASRASLVASGAGAADSRLVSLDTDIATLDAEMGAAVTALVSGVETALLLTPGAATVPQESVLDTLNTLTGGFARIEAEGRVRHALQQPAPPQHQQQQQQQEAV